jgi:hypothetical protein
MAGFREHRIDDPDSIKCEKLFFFSEINSFSRRTLLPEVEKR